MGDDGSSGSTTSWDDKPREVLDRFGQESSLLLERIVGTLLREKEYISNVSHPNIVTRNSQ